MPQLNLVQNQNITINLSKYLNGAVAVITAAETDPNAIFDLQVAGLVDAFGNPEWITIGTYDPILRQSQVHISGTSKTGWADVPGYSAVRVIRTDANVSNGTVGIEFREG